MSNGFVWSSQDETCQVHLDKYPDYVVLSSHINGPNHAHMSLRMSRKDFLALASLVQSQADGMMGEERWSSDA